MRITITIVAVSIFAAIEYLKVRYVLIPFLRTRRGKP